MAPTIMRNALSWTLEPAEVKRLLQAYDKGAKQAAGKLTANAKGNAKGKGNANANAKGNAKAKSNDNAKKGSV